MIYIGNFIQLTNQEAADPLDRRHGEFSLMVGADHMDAALQKFRERIFAMRHTTDFFEGFCRIHLVQILEFETVPAPEAVMVNYKSFAGDPALPFIDCVVPSEEDNACRIVSWDGVTPEVEDGSQVVFMEFTNDPGEV